MSEIGERPDVSVLLMWRVKPTGRARLLEKGEARVMASGCLESARSLYLTGGLVGIALVTRSGELWAWRADAWGELRLVR